MENRMKKNGIEYVLAGEYYIPDLKLPAEERPIGKYGRTVSYTHLDVYKRQPLRSF